MSGLSLKDYLDIREHYTAPTIIYNLRRQENLSPNALKKHFFHELRESLDVDANPWNRSYLFSMFEWVRIDILEDTRNPKWCEQCWLYWCPRCESSSATYIQCWEHM